MDERIVPVLNKISKGFIPSCPRFVRVQEGMAVAGLENGAGVFYEGVPHRRTVAEPVY
jgi:hypothetical protein